MNKRTLIPLYAALFGLCLTSGAQVFAEEQTTPAEAEKRSAAAESVQTQVEKAKTEKAAERRKEIIAEAAAALARTKEALLALDEGDRDAALAAMEKATGKLQIILGRDPALALAPVDVRVLTYDLLATPASVEALVDQAEEYLEDGEVQRARRLVANLASEIQIRSTNIPLATYPEAIQAVAALIDEGKLDAAKAELQAALNTLVVTTDEVVSLPRLRAQHLLDQAEQLAQKEGRSDAEKETLAATLAGVREQLRMAEALGYGTKESFAPMYRQLDEIEEKTTGDTGGQGWFDAIKKQLSDLL